MAQAEDIAEIKKVVERIDSSLNGPEGLMVRMAVGEADRRVIHLKIDSFKKALDDWAKVGLGAIITLLFGVGGFVWAVITHAIVVQIKP